MREVKVILSLETSAVKEKAAEAEASMKTMAEESAKVMRDEAEKTAVAVTTAAENSTSGVESVKEAADDAAESLRKTGEQAKTASASVGNGMRSAAGSIKSAAGATSGIVSALGGVSPQIGLIGQALNLLVSGPVGLLTAAAAAAGAIISRAWNAATVSAEEYRQKLDAIQQMQVAETGRIEESAKASMQYLDRLEELDALEYQGAAAKKEQARLLEMLSNRYTDLGLRVDEATGKLYGFDQARVQIRAQDADRMFDSLKEELTVSEAKLRGMKIRYSVADNLSTGVGDKLDEIFSRNAGDSTASRTALISDLKNFLGGNPIADAGIVEDIRSLIAELQNNVGIRDQLGRVDGTGYRTEADYTAALAAATAREQAAHAAQSAPGADGGHAPTQTPLDNIRTAVDGIVERYRLLQREQELIAEGKEREAAIEKEVAALRQRAGMMGVELTQEQIESVGAAVGSWYDYTHQPPQPEPEKPDRSAELDDIAGKIAALYRPDAPGVITNTLIARGGSAAGVRMPDADRYARATSEATARLVELTEEQKALIAESAFI